DEMKPSSKKNLLFSAALQIEGVDFAVTPELVTLAQAFLLTKTKGSGTGQSLCSDCNQNVRGFQESTDYEAANIVIHRLDALPQGIPVLLKVRRAVHLVESLRDPYDVAFFLRPIKQGDGAQGGGFVAALPTQRDANVPLIVVEGQRCGAAIQKETTDDYCNR